jgi:hypothetical protein
MPAAVHLNDETMFEAREVSHVLSDRMLAAKLVAETIAAQRRPQAALGIGHGLA